MPNAQFASSYGGDYPGHGPLVQIADRDEDMGEMFERHVLWRIKEQAGDGTATGAVLFLSLYEQGMRYIYSKATGRDGRG